MEPNNGVPVLIQYCYVCAKGWHAPRVPGPDGNTANLRCPTCSAPLGQVPPDYSGQAEAHPVWLQLWFNVTPDKAKLAVPAKRGRGPRPT